MADRGYDRSRPVAATTLLAMLVLLGVSGLAGGVALLTGIVELPLEWLEGSPFSDYTIPGLSLFAFLGALPLVVAFGLVRRTLWAWPGVLATGIAVLAWFAVQASVVGWGSALQWFYLLLGLAILGAALLPSVRRYARGPEFVARLAGGR